MISVIIPTYVLDVQIKSLTKKCLQTLREHTNRKDYELIIIDNASPIKIEYFADIYVRNKVNKGNAQAWNQGLKLASGDTLLLCDNDVEFAKDWHKIPIEDDEIVFPRTWCREEDNPTEKLSGFFWLMNRKTFEKLGLVSEEYGLANFEDTDYFINAQKNGVKLKCKDTVTIKHYGRATCDKVDWVKDNYDKNERLYLQKNGYNFPFLNS